MRLRTIAALMASRHGIVARSSGDLRPFDRITHTLDFASGSQDVSPTLWAKADGDAGVEIVDGSGSFGLTGSGDAPVAIELANGDLASTYIAGGQYHQHDSLHFAEIGTSDFFVMMALRFPPNFSAGVGRYAGHKLTLYSVGSTMYVVLGSSPSVHNSFNVFSHAGDIVLVHVAGDRDGNMRSWVNGVVTDTDDISSSDGQNVVNSSALTYGGVGAATSNTFDLIGLAEWLPGDIGTHDQQAIVDAQYAEWTA